MIVKGTYHPLIINKDMKDRFLLKKDTNITERVTFERLSDYPEIAEISYFEKKTKKKIFFTQIGRSSFFTAHLGYDLTCTLVPKTKSYDDQSNIKDMQIYHFFSLEGLLEEHLRKIINKQTSRDRNLPETASYSYSRLVNSLVNNAPLF